MNRMKLKQTMLAVCSVLMASALLLTGCNSGTRVRGDTSDDALEVGSAVVTGGTEREETEEPEETNTIPKGDKYIALTFDDGPTGNEGGRTERLLDGLKERGAHATFFLCGYRVNDYNSMMDRYLAEGHEVGNHTMNHTRMDTDTDDGGLEEVVSNNKLIESYTGEKPTVMRPVGGAYDDSVIEAMKEADMPIILWNLDTLDWKYRDAENVKNNILEQAEDGSIVLMHDLYETTVEGVLAAIDELQEQGYAFVTVSELAKLKGVDLEAGEVYSDFTYETLHPESEDDEEEEVSDEYPTEEESEDLPGTPDEYDDDEDSYPTEEESEVINDTIDDNEDGIPDYLQ